MSYQTSAAAPDRLAAFAAAHPAIDEPLACATCRAVAGLADVTAAACGFGAVGDDLLTPLLDLRAEAAHQAAWVRAVGQAFRTAGADPDGDGVVTARDADLSPIGSASRADRLAEVAALLASLRERAGAGDPRLSGDELAAALGVARELVATAPDPEAEAARILAAVGAGDIAVAVDLLGDDASGAADPAHGAVTALFDLGTLVSLGLDDQPARAERWAHQLTGALAAQHVVGDGGVNDRVDGLALLGGGNAPGTATFGVVLAAALHASGLETRRFGPVHLLYGTTNPLAPAVAAAGARGADGRFTQVPLAHGLVADLARADGGRALAGVLGGGARAGYDLARADALRAAVDPAVTPPDRMGLALDVATRFGERDRVFPAFPELEIYSPAVTSAFGAATQPLLEQWTWHGDHGTIGVPGAAALHPVPDDVLWATVGELAQLPGGDEGLGAALSGATTHRLAAGVVAHQGELAHGARPSPVAPLAPDGLRDLGRLFARTTAAAGQARFEAIADHVEQGPTTGDAVRPILDGALGELPGGSVAAGAVHSLELAASGTPDVTGGGPVTRGLEPTLTAALVRLDLAHHPELATDAVLHALRAAEDAGPTGVYDLIHGDDRVAATGAGRELSELQALVTAQEDLVDVRSATATDQALSVDDG
jgi:hypothetical protein